MAGQPWRYPGQRNADLNNGMPYGGRGAHGTHRPRLQVNHDQYQMPHHQELQHEPYQSPHFQLRGSFMRQRPPSQMPPFQGPPPRFQYSNPPPPPVLNSQNYQQFTPDSNGPNQPTGMIAPNRMNVEPEKQVEKTQRDTDEEWVKVWLNDKSRESNETIQKPKVTISQFHSLIQEYRDLIKSMKQKCDDLKTITNEELWNIVFKEIELMKVRLGELQVTLNDKDLLKEVQQKMKWRQNKRERLRRKRREEYLAECKLQEERNLVHQQIDRWQQIIIQKNKDVEKEKELKATADKILNEVRRKINDVTKCLDILKALNTLRTVRQDSASRRGQNISSSKSRDKEFASASSELTTMLNQQKAMYNEEKKTLEVMLETEQEETKEREKAEKQLKMDNIRKKHEKRILEWLFGKGYKLESHPEKLKKHFRKHVAPTIIENVPLLDMLPCITCLSANDKEQLKSIYWQNGQAEAMVLFFDMLLQRYDWMDQLGAALRYPAVNQTYLADMLNPSGQGWDPMLSFQAFYDQADNSVEDLVRIRREWDMYIVDGARVSGSGIPSSWVNPEEPSSNIWASALMDSK
ncbi:unnamed protein product [Owenia fusiformis]|uniref:Uncharacterized protein n=1 Tax=Owenia fusiformis TaxID=6347 RepID=A0A8J1TXP5_OWEFU|nr:unnamed protein product [Owenia fusiformis]